MKINFKFDIYEYITIKIISFFKKKIDLNKSSLEKLSLGVLVLLINIFKIAFVLIVSLPLGILKETIVLVLFFGVLRFFSLGIHAKSSIGCTIMTLFIYIFSSYLSHNYPLSISIVMILSLISLIIIFVYSPADTYNRPLTDSKKRKKLKIQSLILSILYLLLSIIVNNLIFYNLIMYCLLFQSISIHPITYKIFKQPYSNYKNLIQ
ncbi:putative accessory gene regulator protein [Clostridium bornimense]|uniref:Putative AgrB-like protein n=1 Tax=Clostridium bornimense TaxID=1216932 RepID=W6S0T5_9CLOT|nr:accessory gene regulator B family protein [Clostridium bornimense]CDM70373.1 putative accessory gene regulator protein [Clostridium bornimense]